MEHKLLQKIEQLKQKYPKEVLNLRELEFETKYRKEESDTNFVKYLCLTWGSLYLWTSMKGPIPILRREGRFLHTHRVVRHYFYSFLIIYGLTKLNFQFRLNDTFDKLAKVERHFESLDDGYLQARKPISYQTKM